MLFIDMQKLIINTSQIMIKVKNRHIFKYLDLHNLNEWAMSQTLP